MSEIVGTLDVLEQKIDKLLQKVVQLEAINRTLKKDLKGSKTTIEEQVEMMGAMSEEYNTLKVASALLGSEENKRETKLKINSLIRDIDSCIAQLAD